MEAVESGRFSVYAVNTIEEVLELLTGITAGERDLDGTYPSDSVFGRAAQRLEEWRRLWRNGVKGKGKRNRAGIPSLGRDESFDMCLDLFSHRSESFPLLFRRSSYDSGIVKAPMKQPPRMWPTGARLFGPIAYGNDIVERLVNELVHPL